MDELWRTLLLAIVQGLTEFLPISSSAHLILPSQLLGWQGQGLAFDVVQADFRLTPDEIIVSRSSAVGASLGISMDGYYRNASRTMDFQGVVSPIYLLNGIGSILTRRGEGLVGFAFTLKGPTERPDVAVNPLSVLTPGMFRELFRRPPPTVTQ